MELTLQEKRKLIGFFEFLLDEEVSKPLGEMNSEAVDNYINILLHLQDKHVELSSEFIDEQVRKIFHPEESNVAPETAKTTQKHYSKNKVWLIAACIAILVALFSIISVANDWNVFDFLSEKFGSVHSTPIEEEQDYNGITVINYGNDTNYSTIEEAFKSEKINILFPGVLPNNIEITDIMIYEENGKNKLIYSFSDLDLYAEVYFNTELTQSTKDEATQIKEILGLECYICDMSDINCTQITFEYNDDKYIFSHTDKDFLIKIIENLKELNHEK